MSVESHVDATFFNGEIFLKATPYTCPQAKLSTKNKTDQIPRAYSASITRQFGIPRGHVAATLRNVKAYSHHGGWVFFLAPWSFTYFVGIASYWFPMEGIGAGSMCGGGEKTWWCGGSPCSGATIVVGAF